MSKVPESTILTDAQRMFHNKEALFTNQWTNINEFYFYYQFFRELIVEHPKKELLNALCNQCNEASIKHYFNNPEITSLDRLQAEAKALFSFLKSIEEYFKYEVVLNSLGYGINEGSYKEEIKKKKSS